MTAWNISYCIGSSNVESINIAFLFLNSRVLHCILTIYFLCCPWYFFPVAALFMRVFDATGIVDKLAAVGNRGKKKTPQPVAQTQCLLY